VLPGGTRKPLAAAIIVVAAGLGSAVALASGGHAHASQVALERELRGLVRMPDGPAGAIIVVQRGSQRRVYSAGVRILGSHKPVRAFDHMRIASTAKAFSGAVVLTLVAEHKLKLSDTIAKWLPWLARKWGRVTLAEALHHTSGLPDFTGEEAFLHYATKHLHARPSPRFLLHFVANKELNFTPGNRYEYSNTDNIVAALMAERAARRSYTRLLTSQVEKPLGLRNTTLPRGPGMPAPYLHGYQPNPPGGPEDVSTLFSAAYSWASGGMVSTPADLTRFIRGYVGARLYSRVVRAKQLRFVRGTSDPIGPGTNSAGLAIFRYRTRCGTVYGHTGNISGYTQFMAATLDGKRSVTTSIGAQITQDSKGAKLQAAFKRLRKIETDAVCVALGK
jgi:D-alanyl-D-alanine carboxypeptidase